MKALVVGLGSMGKRRIRNLKALDIEDILGVDTRTDRRDEATAKYGIETGADLESAIVGFDPDVIVISTPPDKHFEPAVAAVNHNIPCFIEASVISSDVAKLLEHCEGGSLIAPSCTMRYFHGPKQIKKLISGGLIGRPLNVNYHVGQYLPDWHPNEDIKDFYVSKRETGACREIVPFELTWLNDVFGDPIPLACAKAKVSDLDADIDDVYHCALKYPGLLLNLTVEVLSHPGLRDMNIAGSEGRLEFSQEHNRIECVNRAGHAAFEFPKIDYDSPYEDELRDFLDAVKRNDRALFSNTLADDYKVLRLLDKLESLCTR